MAQTTELEKLERRHAEHPDGRTFAPLANAYRKRGEFERALELLVPGLEQHPGYIGAYIVLGLCQADLGDDLAAASAFEQVLEADPENVLALKGLADVDERAGRPDAAMRRLGFLLEIDRGNDDARAQLDRLRALPAGPATLEPGTGAEGPPPADDLAFEAPVEGEPLAEAGEGALPGLELTSAFSSESVEPGAASEPPGGLEHPVEFEAGEFEAGEFEPVEAEVPPLDGLESGEPLAVDDAGDPILIEREADIQLHAADRNEFQSASAAEELSASLDDDHDEWGAHELLDAPDPASADSFPPPALDAGVGGEPEASHSEERLELVPADDADLLPEDEPDAESGEWIGIDAGPLDEPDLPGGSDPETAAALVDDAILPAGGDSAWGERIETGAEPAPADQVAAPGEEPMADLEFPAGAAAADLSGFGVVDEGTVEDVDPEEEPALDEAPAADEPELVITDTMAEIYERQGLHHQALRVYRALAARRPGDATLRNRIERLESATPEAESTRVEPASPVARPAWGPAGGGSSAGGFFRSVLGSGLAQAAAGAGAPGTSEPVAREPRSGEAAPTRPAADPVSLSAVFGDELPPAGPAASQASPAPGGGGFSFDAFFGAAHGPGAEPQPGGSRAGAQQDDLEQFHAWLQGLKR